MCVNILFHLHSYNYKIQILLNIILSVPKFASMLIQYSLPQNKKHSMLLLDNHIDTSQCLIKWSVITKAYNTDNGEFYTKYMYNLYKSRRISKKLLDQISLQKLSVLSLFIFYFFWPTDYLQVLSSKYKWLCATYKICIYIHVVNWVSTAGARKSAKFDTQKRL